MLLPVRSVAVSVAVIFFFGLSVVGCISGVSPFTCCKRALAGAVLAYIAATWAVKAINYILVNAMITHQLNQQKEKNSGSKS